MFQQIDWQLPGSDDQPIYGTTHLPEREPVGVLLMAHGFKGYKDYGFFPHLAEEAARAGLVAHRFNFSHSGMTRNIETFERPDLFEKDTFSRQVEDLRTVAAAAHGGEIFGEALPQIWFGHSRGGVTVICTSGQLASGTGHDMARRTPTPIGVVAAASPDRANHLDENQARMLRKAGRMASPSGRTGQLLAVGRSWLDDIEAQGDLLTPRRMIRKGDWPVLIVHGDADATVPVSEAHCLADEAADRTRRVIIEGASHTFDCPNPLPLDATPPAATSRLLSLTCEFAVACTEGVQSG